MLGSNAFLGALDLKRKQAGLAFGGPPEISQFFSANQSGFATASRANSSRLQFLAGVASSLLSQGFVDSIGSLNIETGGLDALLVTLAQGGLGNRKADAGKVFAPDRWARH
ncbi:MAG: hypothetical protein H7A53_11915 [Akkermansiaceae bacterium]|nr:hypothetical protein [Akkermansiaceae bacterium]